MSFNDSHRHIDGYLYLLSSGDPAIFAANHDGKHFPKADSSRGDPLIRIFRLRVGRLVIRAELKLFTAQRDHRVYFSRAARRDIAGCQRYGGK